MTLALPAVLPIAAIAGVTKFHLMGKSLKKYDAPTRLKAHDIFDTDPESEGVKAVDAYIYENYIQPSQSGNFKGDGLKAKRQRFDQRGLDRIFEDVTYTPDTARFGNLSMTGEWTLAKGANPARRILYLHGGAFMLGSAVSHRGLTSNLAKKTGCAVFAPNYRLMPENTRIDGIKDARAAYRWILNNGPDGPEAVERLAVAGDSAGGNLTLMLSNWARDENIRQADAVAAFSPTTDATFESPSIRKNFATDKMLQPLMGRALQIPRPAILWAMWRLNKITPPSPDISPVRASLSNLPPTLVQASRQEMFFDDAKRYAAKAQSQGSPVRLQSWSNVCHVFQAFDTLLPEAHKALDEVAAFFAKQGVRGN